MTLPQSIGQTNANANANAVKVLRNGQVLVIRNGKTYDIMGRQVE